MATPFYTKASPLLSGNAASAATATLGTDTSTLMLDSNATGTSNKKSTSRCNIDDCKKKLGLMLGFDCRCGKKFCGSHRMPEEHKCTFNYRAAADALLEKQLVKVVNDKVDKI